jgi:threonine aldolase
MDIMGRTAGIARRHSVPVHLDGARVFNAATYLGCDVQDICRHADTIMCCLSKGLAAPVGSILAGPADFIARARYNRKLLGGGWRQAGVLAAPGILALTEMTQRLGEDHANARYLAEQLNKIPGIELDVDDVHINMVWLRLPPDIEVTEVTAALAAVGIKASPPYGGRMRLMTHWQVSRAAIDNVVEVMQRVLAGVATKI